jgi:DNA polymerase I-like protein with 3'-5' exonuclease and polymerase domains
MRTNKQSWGEKLQELLADTAAIADGLDIHRAMAAWHFGKLERDVTDEDRAFAKTVNFGYMYTGGFSYGRKLYKNM